MSAEYERLRQALNQATTPEGRQAAAKALQDYLAKQGNASLASSGLHKSYPNTAALSSLPERVKKDSKFANLLDRVVNHK